LKYKVTIFFLIGSILYLIDIGLNSYDDKEIYISDQEIISLVSAWRSQVGRNPNDDEIARIINNLIDEEILYREALILGLEKEDRIIKRRLAQKITFLKQETISNSPSNQELLTYYENNKDKYFIEPTYTFTHYFFSFENNSKERSKKAFEDILIFNPIDSDPFFLGKNFVDMTIKNINSDFGQNFSSLFINIPMKKWIGPVESPFGHHLVFVLDTKEGYYPDITKILNKVEIDLLQSKRDKAIEEFLNEVKPDYKVYINPNLQI